MQEIIDEKTFIAALTAVSIILLVSGAILAVIAWRSKPALRTAGIALMVSGVALGLLWLVYNKVTQHFGLDSVKGLGINLAIFVIVGVALGAAIGLLQRRKGMPS